VYQYLTSCVDVPKKDVAALTKMVDEATDITYRTFIKWCSGPDLTNWKRERGYETDINKKGIYLRNDWAVRFHKSKYKGQPCYFICWSAIEFIWVPTTTRIKSCS
jgi:hypothetical protein